MSALTIQLITLNYNPTVLNLYPRVYILVLMLREVLVVEDLANHQLDMYSTQQVNEKMDSALIRVGERVRAVYTTDHCLIFAFVWQVLVKIPPVISR